jgi:hypothetical protein
MKLVSILCFSVSAPNKHNNYEVTIQTNCSTMIFRYKDELSSRKFIVFYCIVFLIKVIYPA